jgi:uncharacterized membrane protein YqjE
VTSSQPPGGGSHNSGGLPSVASIPLTEDRPGDDARGQSIGSLVKDATAHLSTLLRAEIELARIEITAEVKKGLTGSVMFLVALVLVLLALPFALTAAALGLNNAFPDSWRPWVGFACIFLLMLLGAAALVWLGIKKVKRLRAPQQTIDSVKDTAAALRHRGGDSADLG